MEAAGGCLSSEQTADPAALHNTPFRRALRSAKPTPAGVQNGGDVCGAKREDWLRVVTAARVASWDAAGR
jgi:hypothetical protein